MAKGRKQVVENGKKKWERWMNNQHNLGFIADAFKES